MSAPALCKEYLEKDRLSYEAETAFFLVVQKDISLLIGAAKEVGFSVEYGVFLNHGSISTFDMLLRGVKLCSYINDANEYEWTLDQQMGKWALDPSAIKEQQWTEEQIDYLRWSANWPRKYEAYHKGRTTFETMEEVIEDLKRVTMTKYANKT